MCKCWLAFVASLILGVSVAHAQLLPVGVGKVLSGGGGGITFVRGAVGTMGGGTVTTATVSLASIGSGHTVICRVVSNSNPTFNGVSDGTNTYVQQSSFAGSGLQTYTYAVLSATAVSSPTITATWASNTGFPQIGCDEYSGVTSITAKTAQAQTTTGSGTDVILSGTATAVIGGTAWGSTVAGILTAIPTAGTGYTLRSQDSNLSDWGMSSEDRTIAANPNQSTFSVTSSNSNQVTSVVNLQ